MNEMNTNVVLKKPEKALAAHDIVLLIMRAKVAAVELFDKLKGFKDPTSEEDCNDGARSIARITAFQREVDKKRLEITAPYRTFIDSINAQFKLHVSNVGLSDLKSEINTRCVIWRRAERQRIEAENARIKKEQDAARAKQIEDMKKGKPVEATIPTMRREPEQPKMTSGFERAAWKFEVLDLQKLVQWVMADFEGRCRFICANDVQVGKYVRAEKEKAQLPGVRIWDDVSVVGKI